MLTRLERLAEAETALRRALQAEGDRDEAWMNLGNVRLLLGDVADARRCYVQALALCPDYPAAQRRLDDLDAMIRLQTGGR